MKCDCLFFWGEKSAELTEALRGQPLYGSPSTTTLLRRVMSAARWSNTEERTWWTDTIALKFFFFHNMLSQYPRNCWVSRVSQRGFEGSQSVTSLTNLAFQRKWAGTQTRVTSVLRISARKREKKRRTESTERFPTRPRPDVVLYGRDQNLMSLRTEASDFKNSFVQDCICTLPYKTGRLKVFWLKCQVCMIYGDL